MASSQPARQGIRAVRVSALLLRLAWLLVSGLLAARALRHGVSPDFEWFWHGAEAAVQQQPLYQGDEAWHGGYLYAPIFAVLFRPLLWLPIEWAYASWVAGSLAALLASAFLFERAIATGSMGRAFPGLGLLALLVLAVPTASNFRWGNSNAFMMLLITIAFASILTRRPIWAGLALSLAATLKLTPLLFLGWIALRREWRVLLAFGAGSVLWLAVIPAGVLGSEYTLHETKEWLSAVVLPAAKGENLQEATSSLPRVGERLLSRAAIGTTSDDAGGSENLLPRLFGWSLAGSLLILTAGCAYRESGVGAVSFCLVSAAMLLAAPASRSAHFMQIYPLVGLLLALAAQTAAQSADRVARRARAGIAAAVVCMILLFVGAQFAGVSSKEFSPVTGLSLLLWLTGVALLPRPSGMAPSRGPRTRASRRV